MSHDDAAWMPSRRSMLVLAAGSAAAAAAPAALAADGSARMSAAIDAIVARIMAASPFPGVCLAIERAGQILHRKAYGQGDVENNVPVDTDMVFPVGSITKTVTGLATMQLVAQGRIDLDATAGTYLATLPQPARDIKVRNLLDHTSGLVNYTDVPGFPHDSQASFTREEMLGWFANRPLQFKPGTRWSYTNSGLYVMGLIIEKVTGGTYEDYVGKNIFTPFGMSRSSLAGWRTIIKDRAHGYMRTAGVLQNAPRYDPLVPFSAGAVASTVDDMLKYRRGVFGDGPTTPQVRRLLLKQDRLADGTLIPYSLGCLTMAPFEGHRRIGHPGDIYGFAAQYAYYPDDKVTIILMTNLQNGAIPPASFERHIARVVLGIPEPQIVDLPLSPGQAAQFTGAYEMGNIRFAFEKLTFIYKDGTLAVGFDGSETKGGALPLKYQGGGDFVSSVDDEHRFHFAGTGAGETVTMSYYGGDFLASRV